MVYELPGRREDELPYMDVVSDLDRSVYTPQDTRIVLTSIGRLCSLSPGTDRSNMLVRGSSSDLGIGTLYRAWSLQNDCRALASRASAVEK